MINILGFLLFIWIILADAKRRHFDADKSDHLKSSRQDKALKHSPRFQQKQKFIGSLFSGLKSLKDERCVMCQFLMQKVSANVNLAGGLNPHYGEQLPEEIPAMPEMPKATDESFLEVSSSVSFPNSKDPNRRPQIYPINTADIERSLAKQAYRIIDITMEQVCESRMPPKYYLMACRKVYAYQKRIARLVANKVTPLDICISIGSCDTFTYTSSSVHYPYDGTEFQLLSSLGLETKMKRLEYGYQND